MPQQTPKQPNHHLNAAQIACLQSYSDGEFSGLINEPSKREYDELISSCGDGLIQFMMSELSDSDCNDPHEALRRVDVAVQQLSALHEGMALALTQKAEVEGVVRKASGRPVEIHSIQDIDGPEIKVQTQEGVWTLAPGPGYLISATSPQGVVSQVEYRGTTDRPRMKG